MLIGTGMLFTTGAGLFIWDFFRYAPLRPLAAAAAGAPVPAAPAPEPAG
jgi:hypothetical protein